MNANLNTKKIEMTKNEAKAAGKIGTDEFAMLQKYMEVYPTFEVCIKAAPKRKNEFKGLTYKYMITYIQKSKRENKAAIMADFNTLIAKEKKDKMEGSEHMEAASYLDVREWFLATFPEIKETSQKHKEQIKDILSKVA